MNYRLIALLCLTLLSTAVSAQQYLDMIEAETYSVAEIQKAAEAYFDIAGRGRGTGYKQFKRWEYVALREMDENGYKISNNTLATEAREHRRASKLTGEKLNNSSGNWKQLGPTYWNATSSWNPGVGHITSIGIDLLNTNHIIVGSPTGGVWKTQNGGDTWVPLTDEFSTIDVYALEISPYNNKEYFWGGSGGKIYRSSDAGATWQASGTLSGGGNVNRIVFHPTDPMVMYASATSSGLYRSTNGGSTWTAVSGTGGTRGYDIEFKPGDPNTIYFSGVGFYRSTNGGNSFSLINGLGTETNNYKMIGISPANPNVVYVLEAAGGVFGAFYKSTNSGASFTKLIDGADINFFGYSETGDDDRGQAPRNMEVAVNPFDAEDVHIAGIHTWKSLDGGQNFFLTSYWTPGTANALGVGYNHADIDILKFAGNTLYVGSDGGMYTSDDGGISFVDRSTGLGVREFYKIGVSKTDPNIVTGGSQDNGTSVMRGSNREWADWLGADGMETFVDWSNPNILYGTSQYGSMYISDDQGNSATDIAKPLPDVDGSWVTPFEQDPMEPNTIYVGFENVWKSTDRGNNWVQISDLTLGNLNEMKIAPSDNQRIYTSKGSTLVTTGNGGQDWTTTANPWGSSGINYIAIHPQNPLRVLIVTASSVYHSTDAGLNWTNIGTGLPSGTKYCAAWENTGKNGIYVGGFGTVSYTNDDMQGQWVAYMDGLPNARVYEMEINYVSSTIFAGTYGRGLWESPIYQLAAPVAAFSADQTTGCHQLTVNFTDQSQFTPTSWEWTFEGGNPATSNLQNPTVTFTGVGAHTVSLKVSNQAGDNTYEAIGYITITGPGAPAVADEIRCEQGEVILHAQPQVGEHINWYANSNDSLPLFTGDTFAVNLTQSSTYYVAASNAQVQNLHVGPSDNTIGGGGNHAGNFYQIIDVQKAFRLKTLKVYANGAGNRVFQLRKADGTVLLSKTVLVPAGESRVTLNMDIPTGTDLQLGCPSPANLFRNNSGVSYPYVLDGIMTIKSSTAGLDYYYYLYDLEVEIVEGCESDRVAVQAKIETTPPAAVLTTSGPGNICVGDSVVIVAESVCPGCLVQWSNGETGPSIVAKTEGAYSAIIKNPDNLLCADGPVSNTIFVQVNEIPAAPMLTADGPIAFCLGETVLLQADSSCQGCSILWSNGATGQSITVGQEGLYTATSSNICGASEPSNSISVDILTTPAAPVLAATGPTEFCIGDSVVLTASLNCPNCIVEWSSGQVGETITVYNTGTYTALVKDSSNLVCGQSPASNAIEIKVNSAPSPSAILASGSVNLCPGESVLLSADTPCPDCIITWSNGATGSSISVDSAGIYSLQLSNVCGVAAASNAITVATFAPPSAATLTALDATAFCLGDSVVLLAENLCANCSVQWSNGQSGPSITVYATGSYSATLNDASNPHCGVSPASNSIEIQVGTVPNAPEIIVLGTAVLCVGDSVEIFAANNCQSCSLLWSTGDTSSTISVSSPGIYSASLLNACGSSPASPSVEISYYPVFVPVVAVDSTCHLSAPVGSEYQWFLNGAPIVGATDQHHTATVTGDYSVSMLNTEGCAGVSVAIAVEVCMSGTSNLEGLTSVRVYPNPAQNRIFLELEMLQSQELIFDLFATDGRLMGQIFKGEVASGKQILELQLPDVPAGMYRYRLAGAQGSMNGGLVVKR